ncbi:MAG: alpha-amylase family glycosyl hydrolase [Xenococcaceae cyanobacterium]
MKTDWWKTAIIYQVYLRTFKDGNNDGLGDLIGLLEKLDYIKSLNIDCVYINPFYISPKDSVDGGYDIIDHKAIDPGFGTIDDFLTLIEACHARNLKVVIDQVWNHTSIHHPWFLASSDPAHPDHKLFRDWYLWADGKEDEKGHTLPPNNWIPKFGGDEGDAWQYHPKRKKYYFHNFLKEQPDLNFWNLEVQNAVLDIAEFWMKTGVDALRLDAVGFFFHDRLLRDNPKRKIRDHIFDGVQVATEFDKHHLRYNINQPESQIFMERVRELADKYNVVLLAEVVCSEDSMKEAIGFKGDRRCHLVYTGKGLRYEPLNFEFAKAYVNWIQNYFNDGSFCACYSSHDFPRSMTRLGGLNASLEFGLTLISFFYSLPGSAILYQGDELGLPEAKIPYEKLHCPLAKALYPKHKGRDGARTPLPWIANKKNGGFTEEEIEPYLPVDPKHLVLAVDKQLSDPLSYLQYVRDFLVWREAQPALHGGQLIMVSSAKPMIAFLRETEDQILLCLFNISQENCTFDTRQVLANKERYIFRPSNVSSGVRISTNGALELQKWSFAFFEILSVREEMLDGKKAEIECYRCYSSSSPYLSEAETIYWYSTTSIG